MLYVVTGGSGSGKSEYAENLTVSLGGARVYIATMQVYGEEGRQRVARHRRMREGKRFVTVECPVDLDQITEKTDLYSLISGNVILLECMSNLAANEMFSWDGGKKTAELVKDRILEGVKKLLNQCRHLVVVTNEVFSDGNAYDPETTEYIRCLGMINAALAGMADQVIEVVCGIPVPLK